MLATYVPPKLTPFAFAEADEAMTAALRDALGAQPSREARALALAKTGLETGRWQKIWNSNWGNVKAGDKFEGMFTCITLNEVLRRNGKDVVVWFAPEGELSGPPSQGGKLIGSPIAVPDGHPQTRMRAYANRFDGAFSYVDFVNSGRYSAAWQKLLAGDAAGYVHALKLAGYFTADEAVYAKTVVALQHEFLGRINGESPEQHEPTEEDWASIRAALRGGGALIHDVLPAGEALREFERAPEPETSEPQS